MGQYSSDTGVRRCEVCTEYFRIYSNGSRQCFSECENMLK